MKIFLQHNVLKLRVPLYFGIGIILINLLSRDFFLRIDLTEDRRHSLSVSTKRFLDNLKHNVKIQVYLEGDLPIDYKRFRNSIEEFFNEVSIYSSRIDYKFVDVDELSTKKRKGFFKKLQRRGLYAKNVYIQERGKRIEKIIYPYARIRANRKEYFVRLLKGSSANISQQINRSTEELEYEVMNSINDLTVEFRKKIGLIRGFGEPRKRYLSGLINNINRHYTVEFVDLSEKDNFSKSEVVSSKKDIVSKVISPKGYWEIKKNKLFQCDAVVLTNPTTEISENAKYIIDQYIMSGGKVLFFISSLNINHQKLQRGLDFALPSKLNISDLLFKYGVRINPDLIQDVNSAYSPIVIGTDGQKPRIKWIRWPLFPILNNFGRHIITKNLGPLSTKFISSIDTIETKGVKKTPIVYSSKYSRKDFTPVKINLDELRREPDLKKFNQGPIPVAYLLEGNFSSLYKNRFLPEGFSKNEFLSDSKPTKLLVVSSGNFVLNGIDGKTNKPVSWGYDHFHNQKFAQSEFFANALSYMLNEEGLISARNKNIKLRLLDEAKIKLGYIRWQLINILVPLIILLIWALLWNTIYMTKFQNYPKKNSKP